MMRPTRPAYDPSFYHSLIAICGFILFFGYLGLHTLRGSKVESVPEIVTTKDSESFLLTCTFQWHQLEKDLFEHYRLSLPYLNESFPVPIFPFPKVFKDNKDPTARPLRKLIMNEHYKILLANDLRVSNHFVLHQFCDGHISIDFFSSVSSSSVLSIHTIEISSLSAILDHQFVQRFSEYEIPWYSNRELYYLKISTDGIVQLAVNDELGISLGLSSLSQLIYSPSSVTFPLELIDWPENYWRGLMIDVSRHYQPIKLLKRTIEGMKANKLNLLHLHLTDAQSFPLLLEDDIETGIPLSQLAKKSAFSLEKIYTKDEMKELVSFAKERNIEIIPEIDVPAHSYSWGKAFDEVIVRCDSTAKTEQNPLNVYPLDPSNPLTFQIIKGILKQILEIFPSKYLHIGGDEVNERCWNELPHIVSWAKNNDISSHQITKYFENEVFKIVKDLGKIPIVWQGVFDSNAIPVDEENNGEKGNHPHLRHSQHPNHHRQGRQPSYSTSSSSSGSSSTGTSSLHNELRRNNRSTQNHRVMRGRRLSSSTSALSDLNKPPLLLNFHRNHSSPSFSSPYSLPSKSSFVNNNESFKAIIEPWKCWSGLAIRTATRAMKSKHPVFMSACWYLDFNSDWINFLTLNLMDSTELQYQSEQQTSSSSSLYSPSLSSTSSNITRTSSSSPVKESFSDSNPLLSSSQHSNYFVGGEGALWTESVDCTNYECRVWPRMTAIAYRLWGLGPYFCELSLLSDFQSIPSAYSFSPSFHYYYYFCSHSFKYPLISKVLAAQLPSGDGGLNRSSISTSFVSSLRRPSLPFHNERIEIPINNLLAKLLYASYSFHRFYLSHHLKINAASLILHYPLEVMEREKGKKSISSFFSSSGSGSSGGNKEKPVLIPSFPVKFDEIFVEIEKINRGLLITSSGGVFYPEPSVTSSSSSLSDLSISASFSSSAASLSSTSSRYVFHISSQCLGIPEVIQRPITSSSLSIMQFNIADGSVGERGENMLKWLQTKAKEGIAFIGFCELVGWNSIFSKTDISKNLPLLTMRSANAGFIYSYLTPYSTKSSYPVGIVSIYPFTVVKEYVFPLFQRVILHVYFEKLHLNVFICHFHAHSAEERNKETLYLVKDILTPLLTKKNGHGKLTGVENNTVVDEEPRIIVMGDLNTLSPYDKQQHNENQLIQMIEENSQKSSSSSSSSSLFQRWKKKFLKLNMNNAIPEIDYRPIENLLKYVVFLFFFFGDSLFTFLFFLFFLLFVSKFRFS
jgi:hypothetical protein